MKKIISLLSALAIFSSMAVTGFAAIPQGGTENIKTATSSEPKIQGYVETVDGEGYAIIKFKLINSETLSYSSSRGKVTSNGINLIQATLNLDEEVFDVTESYISGGFTGVNISGDKESWKEFKFVPTSVDSYMINVPEYLFQVDALLKDGYTLDNIPTDAITFANCKVEYTSYANVATSSGATTYTIYGTPDAKTKDYELAIKFTGASTEWPADDEEDDDDDTAIEMVAGNQNIVGGRHDGKAAISAPEAVAVEGIAKITVENSADADRVEEWVAPTTLGNGKTKVLAVVTYDKAAMAGTTFTVKYLNAALEAIKTFTYTVGQ